MVGLSAMATPNDDIAQYGRFMEQCRQFDQDREKYVHEIFGKYCQLQEEHHTLLLDNRNERRSRHLYQQELQKQEDKYAALKQTYDQSLFVLALIDGDGVIFQDALLRAGLHGGSEAATKLQYALQEHIASIYPSSGHWSIMVNVYVSLDKLGQKLASVGLLSHPQELRAFAQAFNVNQPLFSIIDVGYGKERADYKIKEMIRMFSYNPTCQHIVFGGCHDSGYLVNLDQFRHNSDRASRITLLEATNMHKGFADLHNFRRARFDDVFRSELLPEYMPPPPMPTPPPAMPTPSPSLPTPSTVSAPSPAHPVRPKASTPPAVASPPLAKVNSVPSTAPATQTTFPSLTDAAAVKSKKGSDTWATVGKHGVANGTNLQLTTKSNKPKKKIVYYNKDEKRLDEPLPPRDRHAADAIERRMGKTGKNLCNTWHLTGTCTAGNYCRFQHEPKLSPAEKVALQYKSRTLPCKNRECYNFHCYMGHQCTGERDQGYCSFGLSCHLKHTHGMDKTKAIAYDENWEEVDLNDC